MKKRPLAQSLSLLMALLTLVGPAAFVSARPGGTRGGGDGKPRQGVASGTVASVDIATSSFVLHLEGKKRGRRSGQSLDVTIRTNAKTVFTLGDRSPGSFADVTVGARVLVKGTRNEDGSLLAQVVALKSSRPPKESSVKGVIDALDPSTASFLLAARGRKHEDHALLVHTTDSTVFKHSDGSDATFADLAEGEVVEAHGALNPDGGFQATSVKIHGDDDEPHPVKLLGVVDGVDPATSSFSLRLGPGRDAEAPSLIILTDANTAFVMPDGSLGSLGDVTVGARAHVVGTLQEGGVLATSVHVFAPEPPREVAVKGTVASVDADTSSFVLHLGDPRPAVAEDRPAIVVHSTDATAFQKGDGTPATFADVAVGAHVGVKGLANEDRSLNASLVLIAVERPPHDISLRGTVTSVDAEAKSFVLKPGDPREAGPVEHPGVTIRTGGDTAFVNPDGSAATFADLAVGARVAVKGTVNDDRSVYAKMVALAGEEPPHEVGLRGVVASVAAASSSFVLDPGHSDPREDHPGVTVHTGNATVFQRPDGTAATFADVVVGAPVAVKGTANGDRSVNAKLVLIGAEEPPTEIAIAGIVAKVDAERLSFVLHRPGRDDSHPNPGEILVQTDDKTAFTKGDAKAGFGDLAVEAFVKCLGTFNADGSFHASHVAIFVRER